ncbi:hypothetical protein JW964_14375 [candidate division KSB1 bacterium]|nr:hypothetical protein [candidate division KSB1 bacterium]
MLTVQIFSFGFQASGIPRDRMGNGGGFVFDCRHLPNPGRDPAFQSLTGQDNSVKQYLESFPIVADFLKDAFRMVDRAIQNYNERQFKDLMVSFGCTGGQHRSVYCAERLNQYLQQQGISTILTHVELPEIRLRIKLQNLTPASPQSATNAGVNTADRVIFCDTSCPDAKLPEDEAIDGSRSCRTFSALWCNRLKEYVSKNAPCSWRYGKRRPKAGW